MNQLQAMRVFTRVVELESFRLAAKQLGMSAAAITRHIGMLEAHLNMRLINRSTRSFSLTEAGHEYLQGCRVVIDKLDEMESNLYQATRDPRGTLRIACATSFATAGLCALLEAFRVQYPRVSFDVTTFDTHIDIIDGGFDVCFSDEKRLPNSTLVSRRLMRIDEIAVASPTYLARQGTPRDPSELSRHQLLSVADGSPRMWEFADDNEVYRVNAGGTLSSNTSSMVHLAAINHLGIALLPAPIVSADIAKGMLMPILQSFEINGGSRHISLLYSGRNNLSMKVRSFVDFVVSQYRTTDPAVTLRAVA